MLIKLLQSKNGLLTAVILPLAFYGGQLGAEKLQ